MSDTHGRHDAARAGVATLLAAGADTIVHLGDLGGDRDGEPVIDTLAGLRRTDGSPCPARVLFGNVDLDPRSLARYAEAIGVGADHPAGVYRMHGRVLIAHHGHDAQHLAAARRPDAGVDYFLHGHTHQVRDERIGRLRVINPGALFRTARRTVALLDVGADALTILEIDA